MVDNMIRRAPGFDFTNPLEIERELKFEQEIKARCIIETDCGEKVQSGGEQKIANFLHNYGLPVIYDKLMKFERGWVRPDFTINHNGKIIVIEYWGEIYHGASKFAYDANIKFKRELYKYEGIHLIEISPSDLELYFYDHLTEELKKAGLDLSKSMKTS